MRRGTRQLVALIVMALLLAVPAWLVLQQKPTQPETLLSLDPASVTRVAVDTAIGPERLFLKRDGQWWMEQPHQGLADQEHLKRLTEISQAKIMRWRPATDFDATKIGLDQPFAVLTLDDTTLSFGSLAALAPQRYVRVGDHVAMIPALHAVDLAALPEAELAKTTTEASP